MTGLAWPLLVLALAQAPSGPRLTVEEAVDRALARSPTLEAYEAWADEEGAVGGWGTPFPDAELRVNDLRADRLSAPVLAPQQAGFPLDGADLALRMPLPRLDIFGPHQAAVGQRVSRARAEGAAAAQEVAAVVRAHFAAAAGAEREVEIAEARAALAARRLDLRRRRLAEQVGTALEVELAALDVAEEKAALGAARDARDRARARLLRLVGWPEDRAAPTLTRAGAPRCTAALEPAGAGSPEDEGDPLERAPAGAEPPEVRALLARAGAADAEASAGLYEALPWPRFLQLAYEFGPTRVQDSVNFSVAFTVPFADFRQGEIGAARARSRRFRAEARAAAEHLALERAEAWAEARQAALHLRRLDEERAAVRAARERAEQMQAAGEVDPDLLLELEERRIDAAVRRGAALQRCAAAALELDRLGVSLPTPAPSPDEG